jgi:hypothetical protein
MPAISFVAEDKRPVAPVPVSSFSDAGRALMAWVILLLADVSIRATGFPGLYRAIGWWPTRSHRRPDDWRGAAKRVCDSVDCARAYYFRQVWCLQSAAAAVCLLRWRGIPAELVIGVRRLPFFAHAWVEVDAEIIMNDRVGLRSLFIEIVRS